MGGNERILELLNLGLERLNEPQFDGLIGLLLTHQEQDDLSKPVTKASFLKDVDRWGYLDKLKGKLREKWPALLSDVLQQLEELDGGATVGECEGKKPISVNFVNRIVELNAIFQSTILAQYWIVDAPIGYGKTTFLGEIQKRYTAAGWVCCYIGISREAPPTIRALANEIMGQFGCPDRFRGRTGARQVGRRIAACLLSLRVGAQQRVYLSEAQYLGASVFLDNIEVADDQTLLHLADLIGGLYEGLNSGGFFGRQNRLRFFLAGRDARKRVSSILRDRSVYTAEMPLSPYTFSVVQDTVRQYALEAGVVPPEENLRETSAHLMHLTGGHPGCMAAILEELANRRFAEAPFSLQEDQETYLDGVVFPVLEELQSASDRRELVTILETLSVFRRYRPWLLKLLIDKHHIQWDGNEYELETALLETYMLERKNGFLQNDISRRLLAIRLRTREFPRFERLCQEGLSFYEDYLHSPEPWRPEIVAVEWLYQKLQYEYCVEGRRGGQLKQAIMEAARTTLDTLVATWDHREVVPDLADALHEDWELQFMTNYYCSEGGYSPEPYRELLEQVRGNRQQLHGGGQADG